ncbi:MULTISPECIES: 2-oxo-tetronate isomerase [unclassified Brenneria]|uniref:2-oxo-tetronate isomerase n=1 Tax=unclassified Brenneria TaxID=2634434 RepID=UPI001554EE8C|nr:MULTISPECIES: 2-oxo-tetronate isomerase [unclassified Brenneria]MBJ7222115.1 hydroxypyruvate isomerase family protein [Brenneria sp. L3-3C-1]MEE3643359.1 2-oxo-tetronate isomerase [Brenneria sp. L3_3C_1]MEE3651544.1 2-oxo-tetronate isomerase [Brenneria sp. HEZEL_4_2_4]NPD01500.1 hydroxypyruvate isomerase family protein [Brenneria sp. hezel4-2-4]
MPKFAANLSMLFTEVPFLDRFKAAADAGFEAVEYLFPYEYPASLLAEKLRENGLTQVLFNTAPGNIAAGEWGVAALPDRIDDARRDIDAALDYALALNCPSVLVMAGVVPVGADRAAYQQTFIDNLRYAADKFAPHGINIMIEALSAKVKPHYLFSSQYQALELANLIDRPNVYIQLDFFHAQIVDGNLTQIIHDLQGRVGHIQVASVPSRNEPDDEEINYPFLFATLDDVNYSGWIGCEYNPRGKTEAGLSWVKPWLKRKNNL